MALIFPAAQCDASHGWLLYFERQFDGRVFDAVTKEPIEGAVVVAQYNITLCGPLFIPTCGSDAYGFKESRTKKDGSFFIFPRLFVHPWPFALGGRESNLIIYKPGYKFFEARASNLPDDNAIALEPVPQVYYPRYEEKKKAGGVYGIDLRETTLLKDIIAKEEAALRLKSIDSYPDGVIFHAFAESGVMSMPYDIAVDKKYIYVGDGSAKVLHLSTNGRLEKMQNFVRGGLISRGVIAIALKEEDRLWAVNSDCLKEFSSNKDGDYGGMEVHCFHTKGDFPFRLRRFKLNKDGGIYATIDSPHGYTADARPFLVLDVDGKVLYRNEEELFYDVALDVDGNAYVTFDRHRYNTADVSGMGVKKFNKKYEMVKGLEFKDPVVRGKDANVNLWDRNLFIAADGNGIVYLFLRNTIYRYDKDLNYIDSMEMKSPLLGKMDIVAVAVDVEGNFLYALDNQYQRILKYDLRNKKLARKLFIWGIELRSN